MRKITLMLLVSLVSFMAHAQFEGFEGTWTTQTGTGPGGPAGWALANVAGPINPWIQGNGSTQQPAFAGTKAAFMNSENVLNGTTTEDWLISPLWTVPANGQLRFMSRLFLPGDQLNTYEVRISTVNTGTNPQTTLSNFTNVQTWTELQINPSQLEWAEKIVPLTAYANQQVYVALIMKGDNGDRWAVDNVRLVSPCPDPTAGVATNPGDTTANLSWANPGGGSTWEVEVVPAAGSPTGTGVSYTGSLPYPATNLQPSTQYKFYVRALCGTGDLAVWSGWAGPFNFSTSVCPAAQQCNYIFTMTDSFGDGWNGNTMTISQNGITMATIGSTFTTGAGPIAVTVPLCTNQPFQLFWNSGGNWAGEVGVSITNPFAQVLYSKPAGTGAQNSLLFSGQVDCANPACLPVSGLTATSPTSNSIQLNWGGPDTGSWQYYIVPTGAPAPAFSATGVAVTTKPVTATQVTATSAPLLPDTTYQFYVRVMCTGGTGSTWAGPVSFTTLPTCPKPTGLGATLVGDDEATLTWTEAGTATAWEVYVVPTGTAAPTASTVGTPANSNNFLYNTGLTSGTIYQYYVRALCGPGDISTWAGPYTFNTTLCNPSDQCTYNFTVWDSFGDGWNGNTMSVRQNGITIATLTLPTGAGPVVIPVSVCNGIPLQLFWNSGGNFAGEVGVSITNNFSQTFFTKPPGTGAQNTSLHTTAAIDCSTAMCLPPTNLTASNPTMTSIQLGWQGPATGNWAYYIVPAGSPAPTATTVPTGTTTTNPVVVNTGLTAGTNYQYYVRVICSSTTNSTWAGPFAFNTTICAAEDQCNYTFILTDSFGDGWNGNTMTVSQNGVPVATFGSTFTTGVGPISINVPLCNGEPFQLFWNSGGSFAGEVGVSIRNPFNQILYTKPSGTGAQNTLLYTGEVDCDNPACLPPTAVTVTDETTTTISVSWAASVVPGATYEVYYTLSGGAAPGETPTTNVIPTTTNSVVIPNLTASTIYNIYVRTICSATSNSIWTVPLIHETDPLCPEPIDLEVTCLQSTGAAIAWTADGAETSWEVVVQPAVQPAPVSGAVVNEPLYLAEGLTPGTLYTAYVRAICPDVDGFSSWAEIDFRPTVGPGDANPLCTSTISVPSSTGATGYGQIGCLFSTPNPIWYYFTVESPNAPGVGAPMNFTLTQVNNNGVPIDVDFAAFGPFESQLDACSQIDLTPGPNPLIVACSYSGSATENFVIPNAQQDQVYALLITNFNGQPGNISLVQTNAAAPGAPTTSCDPVVELGNAQVHCATESIELTANVDNPGAGTVYSYVWTLDGGPYTPTIVTTGADFQTIEVEELGQHVIGVTITVTDNPDLPTDEDLVSITLSAPFTAPTLAPIVLCGTGGTATVDLSAINYLGTLNPADYQVAGVFPTNAGAQSNTGAINTATPYTTGTTTLFVRIYDVDVPQCFQIAQLSITVNETPTAAISYAGSPFCSGAATGTVTQTGNAGGVYSSTTGLAIDAATGAINVAGSTAGTYTVTYSIAASASCPAFSTTTQVVIVPAPEATISYAGTPYCSDAGTATVTFTGAAGGVYSSTAGLDIDPATGEIDLAASTAGVYTVTYTIPDVGDCAGTDVTTQVTVTELPVAAISYTASPYCSDAGVATVTLTGDTGGTYTADGGLLIDAATGEIDLAANAAGTYNVTYTIAAAGGCVAVTATAQVTITELPAADFTYAFATVCQNAGIQAIALAPGSAVGTFSVDVPGLDINPATGAINPANSQEGVYEVTNTIAAANGCDDVTATFIIEVTPAPVPTFSYAAVAYCKDETTNPIPVLDEVAGTFTAPAGLVINATTGEINLAASTPGTYTVTNTVTGSESCPTVTATTQVTITALPVLTLGQGCIDNFYSVWVNFDADDIYSEDNVTIQWSRNGVVVGNTAVVNISTLGAGTYQVVVTPNGGIACDSSDEIVVTAVNCMTPKGISPNGDGLNDKWDLTGFNVNKVIIFNRYGKEVFSHSGTYTDQFAGLAGNGEKLPSGTYYYMFQRTDGTTETGWVYVNFEE